MTRGGERRLPALLAAMIVLVLLSFSGLAAEPAGGASLTLQLPPTMSADEVKAVLAELVARGARATPPTADASSGQPATGTPEKAWTSGDLVALVHQRAGAAIAAIPGLAALPARWTERVAQEGGTANGTPLFWCATLLGLLAVPFISALVQGFAGRHLRPSSSDDLLPRLKDSAIHLAIAFTTMATLATLLWMLLLAVAPAVPIVRETADQFVIAAVKWRIYIVALLLILSPELPQLRLPHIDDADARTIRRWLGIYLFLNPFFIFLIRLVDRLGFDGDSVFAATMVFAALITPFKIVMILAIRHPIARAILAERAGGAGTVRRLAAALWHWVFIAIVALVFAVSTVELSLGHGVRVPAAASAAQGAIIALAIAWEAMHRLVEKLGGSGAHDDPLAARRPAKVRRVLRQLCNALLIVIGTAWIAELCGLDLVAAPPGSIERVLVRPVLEALLTVIAAWIMWTAFSAIIDERMPRAHAPGNEDEAGSVAASRLGTLLPLLRNMTLIGLAIVASFVALASLGVDIGPLLAGAGVIGLALGFGAQSLVRDIISGLFFLIDDAFRVGEYVDTGRLKGTVEGMSLRSVRLRHQNGQVHTIPFGQIQAVTNFSRDWAVVKFNLQLDASVGIEAVRKTIKRIGQELAADPEYAGDFIQPLKMQGVVDVLQTAIVVRCKFTATPARPATLQRQALKRIMDAFAEMGIRFAPPQVTIQMGGAPAPAA